MGFRAFWVLSALMVVGCGMAPNGFAEESGDGSAPEARAKARSYTYACRCLSAHNCSMVGTRLSLRVGKTTATATYGGEGHGLSFDARYRPRGGNANYLRYNYNENRTLAALIEGPLVTGGYALRTGGSGGYLKLQGNADGFESIKFICRR